jgi:hypothetical protein
MPNGVITHEESESWTNFLYLFIIIMKIIFFGLEIEWNHNYFFNSFYFYIEKKSV